MTSLPGHDPDFGDVLGAPREFTSRQVSELVGLPTYRARRYWRALGFANVPDGEREFTAADVEALRVLLALVDRSALSERQAVELARSFGRAAGRLATSHAESLVEYLDATESDRVGRSRIVQNRVERGLPSLEKLLTYTWRRHLLVAMQRLQPHVTLDEPTRITVGFADLVGFTKLVRRLSEPELADLVRRFESGASDLTVALGGRVVKSLGDEILFVADDPVVGANIALAIAARARRRTIPGIHLGLEYGPVTTQAGDVFGDTVNLASRLTAMAEPNRVLLGPDLARKLAQNPGFRLTALRPTYVRGFGMTVPTELRETTST